MKQSIILGTALAFALSVAPAMAGNLDALKIANSTSMSATELASVEGKKRRKGRRYVGNNSYVSQKNSCYKCYGSYQGNYNSTHQYASSKVVYVNVYVRIGGHGI